MFTHLTKKYLSSISNKVLAFANDESGFIDMDMALIAAMGAAGAIALAKAAQPVMEVFQTVGDALGHNLPNNY